jgi:hypothetical protein
MMKFGRIPPETVTLFQKTIVQARDHIASVLPPEASEQVRAYAIEQVLEIILRDWRENNNTTGMEDADVEDLGNFVGLAATLAGNDLNGQGFPIFQATLKGLLEDWLYNWNAPGDPGPPGPID